MSDKTVQQDDLAKALSALQDIAKGSAAGSTRTTAVESMRDAGASAGSDAGSTQVYHTPANSDRGSWAGSSWDSVSEDGATDSVASDGTDYQAQGKVMKSIMDKLAKGQQLTASEFSILKGFMAKDKDKEDVDKAFPPKAADKDDDDADDKKDKKMDKSLSDYAAEDEQVSKGLEVSEFLAGFAGVISKSLQTMEERVVARVVDSISREASSTGRFQKSLAEAVVSLGEAVSAVSQRVEQVESAPAHAPKALHNVHVLEKGSYGGPQGEPLSKALIASTLVSLVERGEPGVTAHDVLKFDSSNELPPHLERKVRAAVGQ